MVAVHRAVDSHLVEDGHHLLPLGEGAHCKHRQSAGAEEVTGVLTDAGGEDVSREEDERLALLADRLDGRQEPGGPSHWLHAAALDIVHVVEVEDGDGVGPVTPGYRHLVLSCLQTRH